VIQELNRLGIVVDVAHATEDLVKGALKASGKPLLLSHTALAGSRAQGQTALAGRQVSREHAKAVAEAGGLIGVWHFFRDMERYVQGIREMVEVVGVDAVGIGTDQQTAPGILQDYANFGVLADGLLKGGFNAEEAGKILGGNFVRLFGKVVG
jgi:membrane dipeptidase